MSRAIQIDIVFDAVRAYTTKPRKIICGPLTSAGVVRCRALVMELLVSELRLSRSQVAEITKRGGQSTVSTCLNRHRQTRGFAWDVENVTRIYKARFREALNAS